MEPKDLDPVRNAMRSFLGSIKRRIRKPEEDGSTVGQERAEGKPARKKCSVCRWAFGRVVSIGCWLLLIGIVYAVFVPTETNGAFRYGNLWIHYSIYSGAIWPEAVGHVVIAEAAPDDYVYSRSGDIFMAVLSPGIASVPLKRGETFWIDDQRKVMSLGRMLDAGEVESLRMNRVGDGTVISSPEELLATRVGKDAGRACFPESFIATDH